MTTIRHERSTDIAARERLLDTAFGPARFAKASERLREDRTYRRGVRISEFRGGVV